MEDYKKKYEEAMLRMNKWVEGSEIIEPKDVAEFIFPELKEGEDERIRKEIIDYLKSFIPHHDCYLVVKSKQWISWLEKQGEQKPTDKVEPSFEVPKFEAGDWIIGNKIYKVLCVIDGEYRLLLNIDGSIVCAKIKTINKKFHLWTIQDAKVGDVLCIHSSVSDYDCVFLYQNTYEIEPNINVAVAYCCVDVYTNKIEFGIQGPDCIDVRNVKPATKEQSDLLFQKMHEAGYVWDAEKKELKKIEQKPAWSEEDEHILEAIIKEIEANKAAGPEYDEKVYDMFLSWLKSLKERMKGE